MSENDKVEARAIKAMLEVRDAKAGDEAIDNALNRFEATLDDADMHTRRRLEKAMNKIIAARADRAFQAFAEATNEFRALEDGFTLGEQMARQGTQDLFFPAAATHLAQMAGLLIELKQSAETVKGNLDALGSAFDERDLKSLVAEGKAVKSTLDALLADFEEMKAELS